MLKKESNSYKVLIGICCVIITVAISYLITRAGDLNPTSTPADTMYTLDDIYHKLNKYSGSPASWGLNPSAAPASTMHTLSDIYNLLPVFSFPDTGQTTSTTATFGEDHDYTSANSTSTCDISYTNNGDGTTTDNCTGLMWMTCSRGQTYSAGPPIACTGGATTANWETAISYCEGRTYPTGGYTDWRLPNTKELLSIVNFDNYNSAISTSTFPSTVANYYWSGTTYVTSPSYAWSVDFRYGNVTSINKTSSYYVRCVRG